MSAELPGLADLQVQGRTVLCRLDLNLPLEDGQIRSDARLRASLPTLRALRTAGARVAIAAHLGRPARHPEARAALSLEPVAVRLCELLDTEVALCDDCIGDGVRGTLRNLRDGDLLMLENLRFHPGEEKNDPGFARQLAAGFDAYVNDAFGAAHRAHASIVGVPSLVRQIAAGPLLQREVGALLGLREAPAKPFVALVGGAKVSDKIGVLEALLGRVDVLCIGGAMAYTFLQAQGIAVGDSRVEPGAQQVARTILQRAQACGVELLLPVDHVAGQRFADDTPTQQVDGAALQPGQMGLDIGPRSRARFVAAVAGARTLFWNGPLGAYELPAGRAGSEALARAFADATVRGAFSVIGGGDVVAALEASGCAAQMSHVSTGGGASLELLQRGSLPGLDALHQLARQHAQRARREAAQHGSTEDGHDTP